MQGYERKPEWLVDMERAGMESYPQPRSFGAGTGGTSGFYGTAPGVSYAGPVGSMHQSSIAPGASYHAGLVGSTPIMQSGTYHPYSGVTQSMQVLPTAPMPVPTAMEYMPVQQAPFQSQYAPMPFQSQYAPTPPMPAPGIHMRPYVVDERVNGERIIDEHQGIPKEIGEHIKSEGYEYVQGRRERFLVEKTVEVPRTIVKEREREVKKPVIIERIITVPKPEIKEVTRVGPPQIVHQEQIVEGEPQIVVEERVIRKAKKVVQERLIEVPKIEYVERIEYEDRLEYREVPVDKIVEVPEIEYRVKQVEKLVPQAYLEEYFVDSYKEVPVTQVQEVERHETVPILGERVEYMPPPQQVVQMVQMPAMMPVERQHVEMVPVKKVVQKQVPRIVYDEVPAEDEKAHAAPSKQSSACFGPAQQREILNRMNQEGGKMTKDEFVRAMVEMAH